MFRKTLLLLLLTAGVASGASSQFVQYTPPGDFRGPAEEREDLLEQRMRDAQWRFGRLLVDPWIGIRQLGYEDSVSGVSGEQVSDVSVSAGMGVNAYLPVGSDWVWGAFVLPEYTWWQDLEERRRLNGRYGTGLLGNFGRVGMELSLSRRDESTVFSREVETRVNQRLDRGVLEASVDLGKGVLLFAKSTTARVRSLEKELLVLDPGALDRDETIHQGGVSFVLGRGLRLGVAYETSETSFIPREPAAIDRSNSGDGLVLNVEYDTQLFTVLLDLAERSLEPEGASDFIPFSGKTGELNLGWRPLGGLRFEIFTRRELAFSLLGNVSNIEDESIGAALRVSLGSVGSVRVLREEGEVLFVPIEGTQQLERLDDRSSWGLELTTRYRNVTLTLQGLRTDYVSQEPELSREFTRVTASIGLGGEGDAPWR